MASALLDSGESTTGDHCKTQKLEEEKTIDAINNFKTLKPPHLTQKEHKRATSIHQTGSLGGELSDPGDKFQLTIVVIEVVNYGLKGSFLCGEGKGSMIYVGCTFLSQK